MSYLVRFTNSQDKTWEETFETEQQVLECKDKDSIISIQKIEEEKLTIEHLQEQAANKTLQELQEADFKDKHIKVGDLVYFEYTYWDKWDDTYNYENLFGRIKSIHRKSETICPTIIPIARKSGTLLQEDDYHPLTRPKEVQYDQIFKLYDVCTPEYFDKLIQKEEDAKDEHHAKVVKEHESFCKEHDKNIEKLKVLKGML